MALRQTLKTADTFAFEKKAFYSPAEVARILGVSDQTVLDRIHDDKLFAVQLSARIYRIPLAALLQFLGLPPEIRRVVRPNAKVPRTDRDWDARERRR